MGTNIEDGNEIDRDENGLVEDVPYDKLLAMLTGGDDDDVDEPAFGKSGADEKDAPASDVVSIEEGVDLLDKASKGKSRADATDDPTKDAKADPEKSDDSPDGNGGAQEGDEKTDDVGEKPAAERDEFETILDGIADEAVRGKIKDRVKAADDVMAIFKGRDDELKRHGVSAPEAMKRLIDLNAYANRNPGEYLAWAATQFGDAKALIGAAAEKLGLKVVEAQAESADPFEDPEKAQMREELRALKAAQTAPTLGPDAPQNRAMAELQEFKARAKHFDAVAPQVSALAKAHVETTGKVASIADIERFYGLAVTAAGLDAPPAATTPVASAAQPQPAVADQGKQKAEAQSARIERAKAASKSIDGSGQGAGRRPALDADAPLHDVVAHFMRAANKD